MATKTILSKLLYNFHYQHQKNNVCLDFDSL